jgi:hypothetical protein
MAPVDPSQLSSALSDPSYYDHTNPASPFYDPTLDPLFFDPTQVVQTSVNNSNNTTASSDTNKTNANDEFSAVKVRRNRRHMKASEQQMQLQQQLQQSTTVNQPVPVDPQANKVKK